jgi:hypothetical protein
VVSGAVPPVIAVKTAPRPAAIALTTILFALSRPAWASRSSILTWSRLRAPLMLRATSFKSTWIPLQVTDALSSGPSLGRATAASAWENFPTTRPYESSCRYSPLGKCFASRATTDARCLTAASKALMCGVVESFLSYLTPRSSMVSTWWMTLPSTSSGVSFTLLARDEKRSCVFEAFMLRPIFRVYSTKRATLSVSFLATSSFELPV